MQPENRDPESFFLGMELMQHVPQGLTYIKTESGFLRLITNPNQPIETVYENCRDRLLRSVLNYIEGIRIGDQKGPFCPFVRSLENGNGIFVLPVEDEPDLPHVLQDLEQELERIPGYNNPPLLTTVLALFRHPNMLTGEAFEKLEEFRQDQRGACLERGITLAITHPQHPIGGNEDGTRKSRFENAPIFVSEYPFLLLRKLHPRDSVFMHTPESRKQFEKGLG